MKKIISALMAIILCLSLCACDNNNEEVTEQTTTAFVNTLPELESNLQRLQGCWAASENHEDADPSFLCSMPATWDKNMKGYYVVEINRNTLLYRWFHPSGNNGRPSGNYGAYFSEKEYEIEKVTEVSGNEYQTKFTLDLIINEVSKQISITLYDNPDIYKNSFMNNDFEEFMFVKLNDDQLVELMNTMHNIASGVFAKNAVKAELESYSTFKEEPHVKQVDNNTYIVTGWVDTENIYGVPVKRYYEVKLTINNDNKATLEYCKFIK